MMILLIIMMMINNDNDDDDNNNNSHTTSANDNQGVRLLRDCVWCRHTCSIGFGIPFLGSSVNIGTIQRRLAGPLRKDDTHKSRTINMFNRLCACFCGLPSPLLASPLSASSQLIILYYTILYTTTMLQYTILCYTILHYDLRYYTILYNAILSGVGRHAVPLQERSDEAQGQAIIIHVFNSCLY